MDPQARLKELIEKGKKTQLSNSELMEMITIIGPEKAMEAMKK